MSSLIGFHYSPFAEFERLFHDALNTAFWPSVQVGRLERTRATTQPRDTFHPRLDLHESKDSNVVTATFDLPGLKSEVTIDVHHDRLTVSGESDTSNSHEEGGYAVRERRYGKFSRTLQLPFGIKPDDVTARMENGLLTVTFPKAIPEQQPHRVAIQ